MTLGLPVLLIAVGVILLFAADASAFGVEIRMAGAALMIAGLVVLNFKLFLVTSRQNRGEVVQQRRPRR